MRELVQYLTRFDPAFAGKVKGGSDRDLQELTTRCNVSLPKDYEDFLRTMGRDSGPLQFFDGDADFRFDTVLNFYSRPDARPPRGAIFIGTDNSGGGANYFLESLKPAESMQVVRFPIEDDEFPPILVHPGFANMLFTLGFLTFRLQPLPHQTELLADGQKQWHSQNGGSRLDVIAAAALESGLDQVPHTGSWSVAYEGADSGLLYYEVPRFSPSVLVGAETAAALDALTAKLTESLALVRTR